MLIYRTFYDGSCLPSWMYFGSTHEEYLVVFIILQNLAGVTAIVSITKKFDILCIWLKTPRQAPVMFFVVSDP